MTLLTSSISSCLDLLMSSRSEMEGSRKYLLMKPWCHDRNVPHVINSSTAWITTPPYETSC
jgi:hypothetical protein